MTIVFSDEEDRWIDKKPFNWSIKEDCPAKLRKNISKKLKALKAFGRAENEYVDKLTN